MRSRLPSDWRWCAALVGICASLSAVMRISIDSFAIFLLPLSEEFGWGRTETVSIYSLTMLCFGIGCLIAGRAIDRVGPRWTYTAGLLLIALAFLAATVMESLLGFTVVMGGVVGVGAALIGMVSHGVLLTRWFRRNLTLAISLTFAASGVGILIGAPVIQLLIDQYGWRTSYGILSSAAAALALLLPFLPWSRLRARNGGAEVRARPASLMGKSDSRFADLMRDPGLVGLFAIQFLTAVSVFAMNAQIVAFLVEQGFDPVHAATAFGMAGLAGTAGIIVFGRFADWRGRRTAMSIIFAMTIAGLSLLLALLVWPVWPLVTAFVLVYGPTFGARGPIINAMVPYLAGAGPGLGFKMGFVQLGFGIGAASGALLGGWLRDTVGYGGTILMALIAAMAALTLYWAIGVIRRA